MRDWSEDIATATAVAEQTQAAEHLAENRFDAAHAAAEQAGQRELAVRTPEFRDWMSARHATDAAWGHWSQVMDRKPV